LELFHLVGTILYGTLTLHIEDGVKSSLHTKKIDVSIVPRPESRPLLPYNFSQTQIGKRTGWFECSISWIQKHWSN